MARIPESEIERLKREVSLERLAEARGVKLKRHGADFMGLCPFHQDKEPSLVISPKKNLWNCLGACRRGGTVIDWVMRAEGVSFRHAVELLHKQAPLTARPAGAVVKCTIPKLPAPIERNADDRALLAKVTGFYNQTLKESPEALQYLERRGLRSSEMIDRFQLGFANRTLGYRLPASSRLAGAEIRGRLQTLGIIRESGHEHFNGSLVVPIVNLAGEVVQMYGRKITYALREGTPYHLYLPGPQRGVWNEEALAVSKEIILCEALIDALTFWCAGYRHVTTSYGVNGFTPQLKAAFQKHGTQKIYLAYDRDEAGESAAKEHAAELMALGIECFRVQFPKNMDANEYALKVQPAAKALGVLLNRAEWLGKGQRPQLTVIEPTPPTDHYEAPIVRAAKFRSEVIETPIPTEEEEKPEAATKEENAISLPTENPTENVLPLAADEKPVEAAPPSVLSPKIEVPVEIKGEEIILRQGDRRYRVRGLGKNMSYELLRVNLLVSGENLRGEEGFHVDTLDLYSARQRTVFIKQASEELGIKEDVIRRDLGHVLLKLEELQDQQIKQALAPEACEVEIPAEEKTAALGLLRDPHLMERILADFEKCGVIGEELNKQVGYLAAVSRLLDAPLAVIIQSSTAAGKSSLMDAVLALMPEEQRVQYSAMTGQSLFYMGETNLKNKILAIVEEEGAQRASYALKLLQSEAALTIASTGKDPETGRLITHEYRVEGPVMIFLTTTAIDVDEELLNRCLILTVDEEREQTRAIHRMQREAQTLGGLLRKRERDEVLKLHRNAQRLLKPLLVVNEHAPELSFPDGMTRTRRDHMKFLTLIRAITLLHQYQRPVKTAEHRGKAVEYIEATTEDVELAKKLLHEVLGRSLDELRPHTRRLLLLVDAMVRRACEEQQIERTEYRFSRRDVRAYTEWSDSQLKRHLARLEELEYLIVHRGGRGQSFVYELFFEGVDAGAGDGAKVLPGLNGQYDTKKSGLESEKSGPSLAQVRGVSGGGAGAASSAMARLGSAFYENPEKITSEDIAENPVVVVAATAMRKPNGAARAAAGVK